MSSNLRFHRNITRELLKRLLLTTAAVSILVVVAVYHFERNRILKDIRYFAMDRATQLNLRLIDLLDNPAQIKTEELMHRIASGELVHQRTGYFPMAAVFDLNGRRIGEDIEPGYAAKAPRLLQLSPGTLQALDRGELVAEETRFDDRPVVRVGVQLLNSNGDPALNLIGIFILSDDILAEFNQHLRRTLLFALLIVGTTAVVIYPLVLNLVRRVERLSLNLLDANLETIQTLGSAIAKRDSDTDSHNYRVTLYSVRLAEETGLADEEFQGLIKGAFLHDVGKIGTEDKILHKPGKLDGNEARIMQQHVQHGLDIVNRASWLDDAIPIVSAHHEKFDGSGYPHGLSGEDIPIGARIFAIADVFDALTSVRPYKQAYPLQQSLDILREGRGGHFDPELLDRFLELAPELYNTYGGNKTHSVRDEVSRLVGIYFPNETPAADA